MNQKRIGAVLRAIREHRSLSQLNAATIAGLSHSMLCRIEGGNVGLSINTLQSLAGALGVPLEVVMMLCADDIAASQHRLRECLKDFKQVLQTAREVV